MRKQYVLTRLAGLLGWLLGWLWRVGVGSNRFDVCGHIRSKPGYMLTSLGPYEFVVQFGIVLS